MPRHPRSHPRGLALYMIAVLLAATLAVSASTLAVFTDVAPSSASFAAGRVFPGVRTTSAFLVGDASGGGAEADRSSPFAIPGDGRTVATGAWDTAFAGGRYLAFDLGAPLPANVGVAGATFDLTLSSASPSGTMCLYAEARRASDDGLLAAYGGPGSPLACVAGTTPIAVAVPLPVVATTDAANDLRVRVYGRDSAGAPSVIDEATVSGSGAGAPFTLYPVRFRDAAGLDVTTSPWELQGP
jgi:predicted ribosomally synthesized peptide with SipW-like signal peptide